MGIRDKRIEWNGHGSVAYEEKTDDEGRDHYRVLGVLGLEEITPIPQKNRESFRRYLMSELEDMNYDPKPSITFNDESVERPHSYPLNAQEQGAMLDKINRRTPEEVDEANVLKGE